MAIEKYIIDKTDLPKLIQGEELALTQGSKYRAFCIEINGKLTNGDVIKALFPNVHCNETCNEMLMWTDLDGETTRFLKSWWNAPYKVGDTDE